MSRDSIWIIQSTIVAVAIFAAVAILGGVIFAAVHL